MSVVRKRARACMRARARMCVWRWWWCVFLLYQQFSSFVLAAHRVSLFPTTISFTRAVWATRSFKPFVCLTTMQWFLTFCCLKFILWINCSLITLMNAGMKNSERKKHTQTLTEKESRLQWPAFCIHLLFYLRRVFVCSLSFTTDCCIYFMFCCVFCIGFGFSLCPVKHFHLFFFFVIVYWKKRESLPF